MSEQSGDLHLPTGPNISGMLIRGADGNLYFIPDDQLEAFRVPEQGRDLMVEKLLQATPAVHTSIPSHWPTILLCAMQQQQPPETNE